MEEMMISSNGNRKQNRFWLIFSLASTYLWGLAAHAYFLFDNNFTHDSLFELNAAVYSNVFKYASGRFLVPFYRELFRTDITLPWLVGILGLLWIGLTVFFIIRIFHIQSKTLCFLVAGVFTSNLTVSAIIATYLHDFDCDMLALLCATAAVYLWKNCPKGEFLGAILIAISLGLYQSYVFVSVTLVIMVCVFALLDGDSFRTVLFRGFRAIAMIFLGGVFFLIASKVVSNLMHITLSSEFSKLGERSLEFAPKVFLDYSIGAYKNWANHLWNAYSTYPGNIVKVITLLLFGISAISLAVGLLQKSVHKWEKLLCLVLIILFPYGANLIYVMFLGACHDLMIYAIWLFYLFALLLADRLAKQWKDREQASKPMAKTGSYTKVLCMVLVFILLYGNVQLSNGMYLEKDVQYDAYLSLMTRVTGRMEQEPDYIPDETPVVFIGLPEDWNENIPGFEKNDLITGMWATDLIFDPQPQRFQVYFDYVLCTPIKLADDEQWLVMRDKAEVQAMPNYPAQGCIKMLDGILVVKLGDPRAIV